MGARPLTLSVLLAAALAACGPRPRVVEARLRSDHGRLVAEVRVANSGGEGEASVTVRLRERATGRVFAKEQGLPLEPGREAWLAVEVDAPEGDYELSADAQYPP